MPDYQKYLEIVPGKRSGRPCIKGTRITVYDVLGWLSQGMRVSEIVSDYPVLTESSVRACLAYAADRDHYVLVSAA